MRERTLFSAGIVGGLGRFLRPSFHGSDRKLGCARFGGRRVASALRSVSHDPAAPRAGGNTLVAVSSELSSVIMPEWKWDIFAMFVGFGKPAMLYKLWGGSE